MSNSNGTVVGPVPDSNLYGYTPIRAVGIIYLALFGFSTLLHAGQAIKYRMWWIFPSICFGGLLEVVGWSARLASSFSLTNRNLYIIQSTATVLAPTPLLAANFVTFGRIIRILGPGYSRIRPRLYTILFTSSDVISLLVQAGGGGLAASAKSLKGQNLGSHIILAGLLFQTCIIIVYASCAAEYFIRYNKGTPLSKNRRNETANPNGLKHGTLTWNIQLMSYALTFNTACLVIRAIYRIVEFADGWNGKIIHTQVLFNVFDGAMITLAIYTLNFFHPGRLLSSEEEETEMTHVNA
jgi:hypothetical protein